MRKLKRLMYILRRIHKIGPVTELQVAEHLADGVAGKSRYWFVRVLRELDRPNKVNFKAAESAGV